MTDMSALEGDDPLARLWDEHMRAAFPAHLRGRAVEGVEMVLLDADVAGCVSSSLSSVLDESRYGVVLQCIAALEKVLPSIGDEYGSRYYERLRQMAVLAVERWA